MEKLMLFCRASLLLAAMAHGASCALAREPKAPPQPTTYLLDWRGLELESLRQGPQSSCVLMVTEPTAAAGFDTERFAYQTEPHRIDYFAYNLWAERPASMLQPLLVRAMEESGIFKAVVAGPAPAQADLRLDVTILRLLQVFEVDGSSIEFAARLVLVEEATGRLLASRVLTAVVPSSGEDPRSGVAAANRAVAQVLAEAMRIVGTSLDASSTACYSSKQVE